MISILKQIMGCKKDGMDAFDADVLPTVCTF